ncbi:MAG: social motility TPR repeat lipoprotein Tgl [Myxococcaceae bacterium]
MFRSVVLVLAASAVLFGCRHIPDEKERQGAQIHYDLGINAQNSGQPQEAYKEFSEALKLDPFFPEAHNAMGLLLHFGFHKYDDAIAQYQEALKNRPEFSEAKTNMGNVYLEQGKYDEAIKLYEEALNDMLYATPFIAQGNLGWALYKKGDTAGALDHIKAAVTMNPKFCLGYKNLGLIHDAEGKADEACKQYAKYVEACPDVGDAWYRQGVCLGKSGDPAKAKEAFAACQSKAGSNDDLRDQCKRLQDAMQ